MISFAERALFISISIFLIFTEPASSGVIGLDGRNKDALSLKIESIYTFLVADGKIPVRSYSVKEGDDFQSILRDQASFRGTFFPETLDALSCDLNPHACDREIVSSYLQSGSGTLLNILQVLPSKGDWSKLTVGQTVVIPQITIIENIVPVEVKKQPGQSMSDILAGNEICQADRLKCEQLFRYLNYSEDLQSLEGRSGSIFVPSVDYIVDIPTGCAELCAVVSQPIFVDVARKRFATAPFRIVTEQSEEYLERSGISPVVPQFANDPPSNLDINNGTERTKNLSVLPSVLPDEVLNKFNSGKNIIENESWKPTGVFKPFSDSDAIKPFSPKQETLMTVNQYNEFREILKGVRHKGTKQTVMIIDSAFDKHHCEFEERPFVVYDCTNQDGKSAEICMKEDAGAPATGDNVGAVKIVASRDSVLITPAEAMAANPREKCGPAGAMIEETGPQTEAFIAERHGTHLAGVIAAKWDDDFGVGGINPSAKIVAVKIDMARITKESYGVWLLKAIKDIMYEETVRVVDISAGYVPPTAGGAGDALLKHNDWLTTLINDTSDHVLYVVAAGNSSDPSCKTIPACLTRSSKNVVSVVGLDATGTKPLPDVSRNPQFSLGANGESIPGPTPLNKYASMSGSSQAAAIVAGASSLARAVGKGDFWTPIMTRNRLVACSDIQSAEQLDNMFGGRLDIDCLAKGDQDLIELDNGTRLATSVVQISGGAEDQELEFFDLTSEKDDHVGWSEVLGFQKIPGSDEYVLFVEQPPSPNENGIKRIRASLAVSQILKHRPVASFVTTNLSSVTKYVRRTGEKS